MATVTLLALVILAQMRQNGYGNFVSPSHFGSNEAKWLRYIFFLCKININ